MDDVSVVCEHAPPVSVLRCHWKDIAGDYDSDFKVVIIGDSGVGKSCLQLRYQDDTFCEMHHGTIGVEFMCKTIPLDGQIVKLALWGTAGQERFGTLVKSFYRRASGVIVVYDVTNQKSFDNIHAWVESANERANEDVSKLLIGNKCDLERDRVVDFEAAKGYADQLDIPYIETSAKDGTNVEQAFVMIAADMKRRTDHSKAEYNKDRVKLSREATNYKLCY